MTDEVALPEVVGKLCEASKDLWRDTLAEYPDLDERALHVLLLCVESLHRRVEARQALEQFGAVYQDRLGNFRMRPEVKIQQDAELIFLRATRQLGLHLRQKDIGTPFRRMGKLYFSGHRREREA
jgi:hypothetical protein